MTKRELLASTAAPQPVALPAPPASKSNNQAVQRPKPRGNSRAKRRSVLAAAKRSGDDGDDDDGDNGGDGHDGSSGAPPRSGKGYKLGPHAPNPAPADAKWITSNQCCDRYGGRSQMWLWRKVKFDPAFPKP